jgi:hypothetical protein
VCAPTWCTITGAVYGCQAPEPTAYSIVLTPEPVSDAETVTVAMSMYAPSGLRSPLTVAEVSGAVVSSDCGATTVNSVLFSAETFPALSKAR